MKFSLLLSLALGVSAAPQTKPKSYDGYKVVRVNTHGDASVEDKLSAITYDEWEHGFQHIDIVVKPDDVATFEGLGVDYRVLHEDLGASISSESEGVDNKVKRQEDWFASYHNYEDHIDYFRELHAQFPNNSKIVSSGRSVQNRNIFGLHLYGKDGPGKPAVLYHGTVHAREWISTLVSLTIKQ